jgi:hypothetical protein
MRSTIIAILVLAAGSSALACGPEDSLAKLGGGRGGFGGLARNGVNGGGFDPRLAYAQREYNLAKREERKAWVLAKQENARIGSHGI